MDSYRCLGLGNFGFFYAPHVFICSVEGGRVEFCRVNMDGLPQAVAVAAVEDGRTIIGIDALAKERCFPIKTLAMIRAMPENFGRLPSDEPLRSAMADGSITPQIIDDIIRS